ncbi:uncharacterized protein LOC131875873 [Cryptomeria japonica]|uniref:uncharacterized protein LOC131875873 n=1 Tax=Cryptomeria japonica TaxID=3369 RepID=UPI0027DA8B5C|nr:uncharacterized protein LOC131875873 [Cryptomeria japonica]
MDPSHSTDGDWVAHQWQSGGASVAGQWPGGGAVASQKKGSGSRSGGGQGGRRRLSSELGPQAGGGAGSSGGRGGSAIGKRRPEKPAAKRGGEQRGSREAAAARRSRRGPGAGRRPRRTCCGGRKGQPVAVGGAAGGGRRGRTDRSDRLVSSCLQLYELWIEESFAVKTIFNSQPNPNKIKETTTLWKNITKAKETIDCYCKAPQEPSLSPQSTHPSYHHLLINASEICPVYFNFIHQDLKPWEKLGITLKMVEKAQKKASFRVIVVNGGLFVESYHHCHETRDLFTVWGIAQLLRMYPGMVPDLDLMFNCQDKTVVHKSLYKNTEPPPLFHYCGSEDTFDIVFPDWSFWGWAEIQIPPWNRSIQDIQKGNQLVKWLVRDPTAYWKGNPLVSPKRRDLMKCSRTADWNGRLYTQNWGKESKRGFKYSKLSSQCAHRYKIYIEGKAWSVSLKYILACNSPTLLVRPEFYDFFLRGLVSRHHYWPIRPDKKCKDIEFAVEWGNNHTEEAMAIGEAGSYFILNELTMKYVYDYMFHALREYAKLLKYKPTVTKKVLKYCSESILYFANDAEKVYMEESMVTSSSPLPPCKLRKVK